MPALEDYLTKQLFIQKNVVTYRSLSRQFGLHVNAAKTELAKFHEQSIDSPTRAFATYLVSGEPFRPSHPKQSGPSTQTDDGMDVDSDPSSSQNVEVKEEEEVPTITMTLVGEQNIESAKSKYARIFSTHVYCLSPSPLTDAGLICDPSAIVYEADAKDAPTSSIALGRVVGPDVRIGKAPSPVASSSKTAVEPISRKPTLKVKTEKEKAADSLPAVKAGSTSISSVEKDKDKASTVKAKPSGKLDWSKAKKTPEGEKGKAKEKEAEAKAKEESISPVEKAVKKTAKLELNDSPKDEGKRGVKRKAAPPPVSETEEKPVSREKPKQPEKAAEKDKKSNTTPISAPARGEVKLRKNRIISDDEDSDAAPSPAQARKTKGKPRPSVVAADALESDAEKSLRAMMDIDDALVEKASASRPARVKPEPVDDSDVEMAPEPSEAEDVQPTQQDDDDDDLVLKPKPRKRKEKKVVPVGRNGLKKKRVMKSRMTVDPKGYMVTEDYSSYESVDEDDAVEEEAPKKGKGKKAVAAKAKKPASTDADASEAEVPKSKPVARTSSTAKSKKPAGAKASAQGSLKDFFGKPKK